MSDSAAVPSTKVWAGVDALRLKDSPEIFLASSKVPGVSGVHGSYLVSVAIDSERAAHVTSSCVENSLYR